MHSERSRGMLSKPNTILLLNHVRFPVRFDKHDLHPVAVLLVPGLSAPCTVASHLAAVAEAIAQVADEQQIALPALKAGVSCKGERCVPRAAGVQQIWGQVFLSVQSNASHAMLV